MNGKIKSLLLVLLIAISLVGAGCVQQEDGTESKEVTVGYVLWDGEIASTNVIEQVLEKKGYDVEIIAVDAGALYLGVAQGDFDFTTSAWLPVTQENYWNQYGDQLVSVRKNLENTPLGLVVPAYVEIDSIAELNDNKEMFDGEIIGIDPGAGIMQNTENAIEAYGLDYKLVSSSTAGMNAQLRKAIDDEEPIVVTLWSPHWSFDRWDLKYLDDPEGAFGQADNVETLARIGLEEDMPEVYDVLTRFHWTHEDIQSVMSDMENGMAPEDAAAKWIENNPEKVNEWLGEEL
ncbi:glycine betaine ABC transporter substrate-binding protein [Methanococcoides alaskense]|uniref:Glycine betaine/proline transport system substrate-binding protein n=1 Tax=Methanococcoides alaskense TaxID=325778 RepID=A0AA90U1V5_9EURY|nr:glycine betaine ABC transporter substrate-binding protein [Methanococcoides alaskense]MDA0524323.1 glycine betaine ABC transporter substrate-binding protein [Methanococcoides alaskense]MDR6223724.1 glycine betaine/proline transport system substrate-binding protein [Methanococcoides alaskense]